MRLLHTSDWHIGRTFHGYSTAAHLRTVLGSLVDIVKEKRVDVVLIAGDVFDSATPAAEYVDLLDEALHAISETGAKVVVTSGNHDSAARLGFMARSVAKNGIFIATRPEAHATPILLSDEHGAVAIYGIPFLEPSLVRHRWPETELRNQAQVMRFAMDNIRADAATREARTVVLAHCFAAGVAEQQEDQTVGLERDITAGGLDVVPLAVFEGVDYMALGHIHGRATLAPGVRYSGAPLHYSFSEAHKERGGWIVDLNATGLEKAEWISLPVPRRLTRLTGTIDDLLENPSHTEFEQDWVDATLTDQVRPLDAMRRLQERFPYCAHLQHRPDVVVERTSATYAERIAGKTDLEVVDEFLGHVRNGVTATDAERALIADVTTANA